jgi:hypothetical protein
VLVLLPPLQALAVEALAGLACRRLRAVLHLLFVALIAIQALKDIASSAGSAVLMPAAATLGLTAVVGYARLSGLRSFVTLSPAQAVFRAIFLFFSPMSDLAFASGSVETADVSSRVPVVMVTFDEVSTIAFEDARERIDPVLYPNLAALARDGSRFRYATAPTGLTGPATPTMLTGAVAKRRHPPILSSYPRNLFAARPPLPDEGLPGGHRPVPATCARTRAVRAPPPATAPPASELGLVYLHVIAPQGIERGLPSVSDTVAGFGTGTTTVEGSPGHTGHRAVLHELSGARPARFENFVRSIDRTARPTL